MRLARVFRSPARTGLPLGLEVKLRPEDGEIIVLAERVNHIGKARSMRRRRL